MARSKIFAHYWVEHSEHSRPFNSVLEAVEFLGQGRRAHDVAVDCITRSDGSTILTREEVHRLLQMDDAARDGFLEILDRRYGQESRARGGEPLSMPRR
jgi:hypothetical protein